MSDGQERIARWAQKLRRRLSTVGNEVTPTQVSAMIGLMGEAYVEGQRDGRAAALRYIGGECQKEVEAITGDGL